MSEQRSSGHPGRDRGQAAADAQQRARRVVAICVALAVTLIGLAAALFWPADSGGAAVTSLGGPAERIDVVYFHRTQRCESCLWAGQTAKWTVETYFPKELASGRVTFREVDVQSADNVAIARRYGASGSSLYLNFVQDGQDHIVQARETYPYIGNRDRYSALLRAKVSSGLEGRQ